MPSPSVGARHVDSVSPKKSAVVLSWASRRPGCQPPLIRLSTTPALGSLKNRRGSGGGGASDDKRANGGRRQSHLEVLIARPWIFPVSIRVPSRRTHQRQHQKKARAEESSGPPVATQQTHAALGLIWFTKGYQQITRSSSKPSAVIGPSQGPRNQRPAPPGCQDTPLRRRILRRRLNAIQPTRPLTPRSPQLFAPTRRSGAQSVPSPRAGPGPSTPAATTFIPTGKRGIWAAIFAACVLCRGAA